MPSGPSELFDDYSLAGFEATPELMVVRLDSIRDRTVAVDSSEVIEFVEETRELPPDTLVMLTRDGISLFPPERESNA